ncbi:MAG: hypothetical protein ACOZAM_25370 [Pseudomonadota bacterium]
MMAILARVGLGGIGLKGSVTLVLTLFTVFFAAGLAVKLYLAGIHAERVRTLEATIAQIKAALLANETVIRQAEADMRRAEEEERELKELIDALQNEKSCPLTREHVDGVRRVDESP